MKIAGTVTARDYLAAQYLHIKPRPVFAVIGIVLLSVILAMLVMSFSWFVVCLLLYLSAYFLIYIPWRSNRTYKQYKAIQLPVTVELTESNIYVESSRGKGTMSWNEILKIKKNREMVLVYPSDTMFHIFPSHFFGSAEEFQAFVAVLESKL